MDSELVVFLNLIDSDWKDGQICDDDNGGGGDGGCFIDALRY
jgi:hypothetical protein